ncbi:hypothetical protein ACFOON_11215 [Novosphingobium piscinae]|uniref:Ribbon-helix-helix protein CopG domain-containing protein n=1 Tax=Novosphingobium piscinae TaxID=1507448 RepID=A0A7X1FWE6_9SPHN|nr:hypothetical protein [Novosphingobium piscinae]MBC2668211.1 hypothetical protein [Novosphingobium piscinae]
MTRPICLQVYISSELSALVRQAAQAQGVSMSEWVRALVVRACDGDDPAVRIEATIERIARRSVFLMVGIDALLAGHPDHALRGRAHQAYARKCKELGLSSAGEGGSDEA